MNAPIISRRSFAKGIGGIVLAFTLAPRDLPAQDAARLPGSLQTNRRLDAWLRINADGTATVFTGKVELGQGILTALQQIAAEELDLPLNRLKIISGDTGATPNEGQTAGSQSVENSGTALRMAGAEVRAVLVDLAAKKLGVAADTLTVENGVISASDGRKVTYGELAAEADLKREATAKFKPKDPSTHKIVGQSIARADIPPKLFGGIAYVQDLRPAGMVHGRVVRPPRYGSTLESIDDASVKSLPGVIAVVRDGSFLGVIAQREEQAVKAREALAKAAKWKLGPELPDPANIHAHLKSLPNTTSEIGVKQATVLASAGKMLEATYTKPYLAHAPIGPSAAIAEFKDGKLSVWSHTQGVFPLRAELVKALKMQPQDIRCIHVEGSGCYGQTGADDVTLDAALLARAAPGRPVRLQWMRDDEFAWEPYGAAMSMNVPRRRQQDCRLALRAVEQHPLDAAAVDQWRQCARGLVHGRAADARPAAGHSTAGGRWRPQRRPALRFPEPEDRASLHSADADPGVGAAHARRLCQRVRARILHGRDGGAGEGRSGGVPSGAHEGSAGARGDREGRCDR
jgi:nicotinate dehydrogenase subunit B